MGFCDSGKRISAIDHRLKLSRFAKALKQKKVCGRSRTTTPVTFLPHTIDWKGAPEQLPKLARDQQEASIISQNTLAPRERRISDCV